MVCSSKRVVSRRIWIAFTCVIGGNMSIYLYTLAVSPSWGVADNTKVGVSLRSFSNDEGPSRVWMALLEQHSPSSPVFHNLRRFTDAISPTAVKRPKLWKTGEDGLCCSSSTIQSRLGPSSLLKERSETPIVFVVFVMY